MKEEKGEWVSWYDFLGQPEPINSKTKKLELINKIKDTDLLTMDSYELMVIIGQGNLPDEIRNLLDTDAGTPERLIAIQNVIDELTENEDEFIEDDNIVVNEIIEDNDLSQIDDIDNDITDDEEDEPSLPTISTVDEFRSLDNTIYSSMDEEAIESLIQYKFHKLWNYVLNGQLSVDKIKNEVGGEYFTIIKNSFLKEYNEVSEWSPKGNYSNCLIPNLMQKLTVHRLVKYKSYGNWSGTGAGKTLSFILSSREIDARLTLIIVVNSTILQIGQSILDAYPDSIIHFNYRKGQIFDRTRHNYLILNYEKFQQDYSEERFQSLTNDNLIDFIVIDEVHNAKQRQGSEESVRRAVLNRLMGRVREKNPNLYTSVMSATPVINDLFEAKSLLRLLTGKEYDDIDTRRTLNNALKIYQQLFLNGLRFKPRYDISIQELTGHNTPDLNIDGTFLVNDLISNRINLLGTEALLLDEKLKSIDKYLKKGVIIYSHYVDNIINRTKVYVENKGFTVERYTGEESAEYRTEILYNFINGNIDILIASDPITTGVDGLQKVCNRMIMLTLPWTDSIYTQLKGRVYRQGFNTDFTHVEIVIPQVRIELDEGEFWSWDIQRLNLIKNKRTLADAAVDGLIPSKILPTKETMHKKAMESLIAWKERCNNGNLYTFERENINIDLYPELNEEERTYRINSELMEFNRRGKITHSSTMNKEFNNNPDSFFKYHKLRRERMKEWNEIPYEYIAKQIKNTDDIVIDFGCGDNQFKKCIPNNKVISIDHIAFDDSVIACDMKDIKEYVDNQSVDIAVFSLSLWGTNFKDYLKEAHRVLTKRGLIYIAEPIHNYENEDSNINLINLIQEAGFEVVGNIERRSKFIYIKGVKIK